MTEFIVWLVVFGIIGFVLLLIIGFIKIASDNIKKEWNKKEGASSVSAETLIVGRETISPIKIEINSKNYTRKGIDFSKDFSQGTVSRKLKDIPKNKLLKRLIDGEPIECKCTKYGLWKYCVTSIDDGRAVGFVSEEDDAGRIMIESVFDVKIKDNRTINISRDGFSDTYNIHTDFQAAQPVKADYYRDSSYAVYDRNNVTIALV